VRLDSHGPWADHARSQIHRLLSHEKLSIASRADRWVPPCKGKAALDVVTAHGRTLLNLTL